MVDVNKCFVGEKIHWDTTSTFTVEGEKPGIFVTYTWQPLIKPPPDTLVWRPVSHFCL